MAFLQLRPPFAIRSKVWGEFKGGVVFQKYVLRINTYSPFLIGFLQFISNTPNISTILLLNKHRIVPI